MGAHLKHLSPEEQQLVLQERLRVRATTQRIFNKTEKGRAITKKYRSNDHKETWSTTRIKAREEYNKKRRELRAQHSKWVKPRFTFIGKGRRPKREPDITEYILSAIRNKLRNIGKQSKERGLEFNITPLDFLVFPTHCPILGIELKYRDGDYDNSASVDRINNSKGYIPGNVHIISNRANRLKSNATVAEMKKIYEFFSSPVRGYDANASPLTSGE